MKKSRFDNMLRENYDILTTDERITNINTLDRPVYSPLDMREDEISPEELIFLATPTTVGFRGKYAFLSNMAYTPFEMKGHWFLTAEHAFHFWKCKYADEAKLFDAENPDSIQNPYEAKRMGRKVVMRDNWKDIRVKVMEAVVRAKFEQNEHLIKKLIEMDGTICEDNNWNDRFWGKVNGEGENHLGQILTKIRDEWREIIEEEEKQGIYRF